ncbi:hypothetical protein HaLaN_29913 [Haematococcus lacustris]|uniref:Uncharacterized protein n=1 Tax=Haematococcus lacustris TaxID=44745 RepID=A0A6A0AEF0_HAELA|nr:hypothetical protein HaLaN_29913 [Haematococcus lacustris]
MACSKQSYIIVKLRPSTVVLRRRKAACVHWFEDWGRGCFAFHRDCGARPGGRVNNLLTFLPWLTHVSFGLTNRVML